MAKKKIDDFDGVINRNDFSQKNKHETYRKAKFQLTSTKIVHNDNIIIIIIQYITKQDHLIPYKEICMILCGLIWFSIVYYPNAIPCKVSNGLD